ncbi:PREDICTED: uncharacterized protein LOC109592159, partial [Amphimedon queenslandica]|uniref:Uncharacterized protein n=1 Tax=Amphimedon queenslandica TaxID=400682 RepID=A0AAN0K282_AMPQE
MMAGVDDEDCGGDCDEVDHLDEAVTKSRSSFKTMFNKGVKYQAYLKRVVETKRINDEKKMETLQINDDDQNDDDNLYPFDSFNTLGAIGFSVYDNPFMEVSNLLMSTSGVCDLTKTTQTKTTLEDTTNEPLDTESEDNEESSHGIREVARY